MKRITNVKWLKKLMMTLVLTVSVLLLNGCAVMSVILIPVFGNTVEKSNTKSAFSDVKNALSIYLAEKADGKGGVIVEDGTVFEVYKAKKYYYFIYNNNGLTECDEINDEPNHGAPIYTDNISGFPENVTMYKPYWYSWDW